MSGGYGATVAARYDGEASHALGPGEASHWLAELRSCIGGPAGRRILDVGSGTGLLLEVLVRAGARARGIEPSAVMIAQALRRRPLLRRIRVHHGGTHETSAFRSGSLDAIVCRQVLCHLTDPDAAFAAWRRWLRPGGALVLADGLWPPEAWAEADLAAQPFASLAGPEPVAVALAQAGFDIRTAQRWFAVEAARRRAVGPDQAPRYLVVALKRWGPGGRRQRV